MYKIILGLISIMAMMSCSENSSRSKSSIKLEQNQLESESVDNSVSRMEEIENSTNKEIYSEVKMKQLMISSGQFSPYSETVIANCKFQIVKNQKNDTIYLSTADPKFVTPEGYKVEDEWKTIAKNDTKNIEKMPGWGYYIQLESGWNLGFCEGQSCTDKAPDNGSIVKWIFKRNE